MSPETDLTQRLEILLAEDPSAADRRMIERLPPAALQGIVLYGAGTLGRSVARRLAGSGAVLAFADDTPGKAGSEVEGVPVLTLADAARRFGDASFVVTILNNALSFREARERLRSAGVCAILSFFDLAQARPDQFLPYGNTVRPSELLAQSDDIRAAFQLMADAESRRQFIGHLAFRLHVDFEALPPNSGSHYLPADLFPTLPEDIGFVDCGAYDGDTVEFFVRRQQSRFRRIDAFEPDPGNVARMRRRLAGLPPEQQARIHVHEAAVGASAGRLRFAATGGMGSALGSSGDIEVEVRRIDSVASPADGSTFIKLDVEGHEAEAIEGCGALLDSVRTILAVSVYHRPFDLWRLPLLISAKAPSHALYLRTEGEDGADIICYALAASEAGDAVRRSETSRDEAWPNQDRS